MQLGERTMKIKRMLAGFLACTVLCSLIVLPGASAAKMSAFGDIADATTAEAAETLRLLGVVSGDGNGNFNPYGVLTRAQFCKMAVEIMGNGDKVMAQMNRTVFQ
ncbi:MAG: S-layer homology domain-containing protein, partial [Clostridia bacterium]|nr:S-layer homology domain-containing protein [Clostridia bacterium]